MNNIFRFIVFFLLLCNQQLSAQNVTDSIFQLIESRQWETMPFSLQAKKLDESVNFLIRKKPEQTLQLATLLHKLAVLNNDSITEVNALKYIGNCNFHQNKKLMAILQYTKSRSRAEEIGYTKGVSAAFYNIGLVYFYSDKYDNALINFRKSLQLDSISGNQQGIANCHSVIGAVFEKQEQYTKAIKYIKKAHETGISLNDSLIITNTLHNLGEVYKKQGDFITALNYYNQSEEYRTKSKPSVSQIQNNYSIGEIYEKTSRIDSALRIYKLVIQQSQKIEYIKGEGMALNSIGNIYKNQIQYDKALSKYVISLEIMQKLEDNTGIIIASDNIGNIYELKKDFKSALEYYNLALGIKQSINNFNGIAISKSNIGMLHFKMDDIPKAVGYLTEALEMNKQTENEIEIANNAKNLGIIYAQNNDYQKAEFYLNECIVIAKKKKILQLQKSSYGLLSNIFAQKGNYKKAFEYNRLTSILKDSIFGIETQNQLDDIKVKYDTDKKAQENKLLKKENKLKNEVIFWQKLMGIGVSFVLLLTAFIAVIFFRGRQQQKYANKILREQKSLIEGQSAKLEHQNEKLIELDQFKEGMTGMIVHDLKNPLNSIINIPKSFSLEKQLQNTQQSGKQMLNMVMNILDVQKYEENKMVVDKSNHSLYELSKNAINEVGFLAGQKSIIIENNIPAEIGVQADKEIIIRVFINLLTNAIKYTTNNGTVAINLQGFKNLEGLLKISVTDNGEGIPKNKLHKVFDKFGQVVAKKSGGVRSTGLGLTFCKLAVEAHGGKIGVESKETIGTTFWFTLAIGEKHEKVKKAQTIIKAEGLELTEDDKFAINPYISNLKELLIYETTEIEKILEKIDFSTSINLQKWKAEMDEVLFTLNEEKYSELLRVVI